MKYSLAFYCHLQLTFYLIFHTCTYPAIVHEAGRAVAAAPLPTVVVVVVAAVVGPDIPSQTFSKTDSW